MEINVFLLCFNEAFLLPHTVRHYKKYLPCCKIIIYDNESTDNSVKIAEELGCIVVSWNSDGNNDENLKTYLRNNIWKNCKQGWIIMADMDEFLCVTQHDLKKEFDSGVTILKIEGYEIIGDSKKIDLSDISNLHDIKKYITSNWESKHLCFLREAITDINYYPGSHSCEPHGNIVYSSNIYMNKHMCWLGLPYIINKLTKRYERSGKNRENGWSLHYTQDIDKIQNMHNYNNNNCKIFD